MESKKTLLISVLTIGGSVSLTLVSWFYQVTSDMLGFNLTDASFIFYGYPFAWFRASWGAFRLPNWEYDIQPYGLAGNVVFYMWLIFGILLVGMVLYKRIRSRASSSTA